MDDLKADVQDPLEEINLGSENHPKLIYVSKRLPDVVKVAYINYLHEYKDCFAWEYEEMPGLRRDFVMHRLPIKEGFRPYKQAPRRISAEVNLRVKEELEHLLRVGFMRPTQYVEWLSIICSGA